MYRFGLTVIVFSLLFLSSALAQLQTGHDVAVADTESGKVRGYIQDGIYTWKGIPYAQAERFEASRKTEPWEDVRSSLTWGPVCPLENPTTSVSDEVEFVFDHDWGYTSEECLCLNVWSPGINDDKKRPVMVWIHGGGFVAGSSQELPSYHGENLARKGDVVVVTVNHRLNVLGFLDLSAYGEKYKHSANVSMLDLVAALEWVQANIENFGGDPDNVMIFGQSGGGAKVNTLMAMPSAEGLFHKAVNQSGSFRMGMLNKEITQRISAEVLKELGLEAEQIDSLQSLPYPALSAAGRNALATVQAQMKEEGKPIIGFGLSWGPSMDEEVLPNQLFSREAFQLSKDIPLLIGTTKNEFFASLQTGLSEGTEEQIRGYIQNQYGPKAEAYMEAVQKAYPEDTRPSDLIDVDVLFRPGAVYQANQKSLLEGGAPVYMYLFTWQSPVMDGKYKAIHCMELPFVFDNVDRCKNMTGGGEEAHALADKVSRAWINFARHGDPNHEGLPDWPAYNTKNTATMHFDNTCEVKPQMDKELFELLEVN